MILQNNATTSIGHFSNYTSVPPNERTFSMTFGSGCSDLVVYNKSLLIKQNGSAGAEDGATVDFAPTGEATYSSFGCKAPTPPFTVDADPISMTVCAGTTITLNGRAIGQQSILWSSPSGIFSSPTTIATNYTISPEDLAKTIVLTLEANNNCGLKITDSLNLFVTESAIPNFSTILDLCPTDTPPDLSTKSPNGISGTWNPASISTAASADYIFTPDPGQCASQAVLAVTVNRQIMPDFKTELELCPTDTPPDLNTKSPNGISGTWNPASISTAASADYIFTPDPGQCASQAALAVNLFSFSYSITQESINNKYLIKVVPNTNYPLSDYTYTWFNSQGVEITYKTSTFDFTEYIKI